MNLLMAWIWLPWAWGSSPEVPPERAPWEVDCDEDAEHGCIPPATERWDAVVLATCVGSRTSCPYDLPWYTENTARSVQPDGSVIYVDAQGQRAGNICQPALDYVVQETLAARQGFHRPAEGFVISFHLNQGPTVPVGTRLVMFLLSNESMRA